MKNHDREAAQAVSDRRQTVHVGFVGGGKGCYELLKLFDSYRPRHLDVAIVGVADPVRDAIGRLYAEQHGIPVYDDLHQLLNLEVDLVIELTGNDDVLREIFRSKAEKTKVLDHLGALFLWEIIAVLEEKIHLENRVSTLDTMSAVGEMAYSLTHRLRNPLMAAGGIVRKCMTRTDVPHSVRRRLKKVARALQEMEEVVSDICDVVRPLKPHFKLVDLNLFFEEFCKSAALESRFVHATFSCDVEENLPEVYIDPSLMRQALWHLLENCFEASPEGKAVIHLQVELCYDAILIQMRDEGPGFTSISPDLALHPFVTTRPGQMGMGLTLCRQIILEHGGDMELSTASGKGVNVILKLPLHFTPPKSSNRL